MISTDSAPLDERQRAMLEAMGIKFWGAENIPSKSPEVLTKITQVASENVANVAFQALHTTPASDKISHKAPLIAAPPLRTPPVTAELSPLPEGIAHMDWSALQHAVSTCRACSLCHTRKNTVFGVGAATGETQIPQADWLIVGEAPGENEDMEGEPFVGQAGKLLDNMLHAVKIDGQRLGRQSNVYIVNVLKCRPPANRNPSAQEVAMCQPYLHRQIALLQPKIIVAMGRFAMQSLLGSTEPLGKLRGRAHTLPAVISCAPVIVTYHPAYLLRNLPDKAKAWQDLLLAVETLQATTSQTGLLATAHNSPD